MKLTFNPLGDPFDFTGGDSAENFSHKFIPNGSSKEVPENQQMLFDGDLLVYGDLLVSGEIKEITDFGNDSFFYTKIISTENVTVNTNRLLLYKDNLMVDGNLLVYGTVAGV
jgi:hypothetical protein